MKDEFSHIERLLERASGSVALSASEKDAGRDTLRVYLAQNRAKRSPWSRVLAYGLRGVVAVALIMATGSGAAFAAEDSLPGSPLYLLKVKVTEPVRAALATDPADRAEFEIERAHRRLSEYAQVSVAEASDPSLEADLAQSLTTHVNNAKEAIALLNETGETSDAFAAASDLAATLETHAIVLDVIAEESAASSTHPVEDALTDALTDAYELASSSEQAIETASQEDVAAAVDDTQADVSVLANELEQKMSILSETFDTADAQEGDQGLAEISALVASGKAAEESGDLPGALLFYTEANSKLGELAILLEADTDLGVDIIGETEQ